MIRSEPSPAQLVLRALLLAVAVFLLIPPLFVLPGAFAPGLPFVGRFALFLDSALAMLWVLILVSVVLSATAIWLARTTFGVLVLAVAITLGIGAGIITFQVFSFAGEHGASVSLQRQLGPLAPVGEPDAHLTMATVDGQTLDAEIWRPPEGAPNDSPTGRPGIVFVHGGGFVGGDLRIRVSTTRVLADAGFVVVDVQYRLAPPPRWQDAPRDVVCALAWLPSVAAQYGLDVGRVALMGESAGGSLVLVAGYGGGSEALPSSCGGDPIRPAAVVAISPAADLAGIWSDKTLESPDGRPFPEAFVGGPPSDFPDRYEAASPFVYAAPDAPPTLIVAGSIDHLVRTARAISTAERLTTAGVDVQLVIIPYADHGFDGQANGLGSQILETVVPVFLQQVLVTG